MLFSWLRALRNKISHAKPAKQVHRRQGSKFTPPLWVERLEDRTVPATFLWVANSTSWAAASSWTLISGSSTLDYPDAVGDVAQFTGAYLAAQLPSISSAITVGEIDFGVTGSNGVTLSAAGSGALSLQNSAGAAILDVLSTNTAANTISIPIASSGALNIANSETGSATQTLAGGITAGAALTMSNSGKLTVSGAVTATSGFMLTNNSSTATFSNTITTGTAANTSLTAIVNGGTLILDKDNDVAAIGPLSTFTVNNGGTLSSGSNTKLADGQPNFGLGQITLNNGSTLNVKNTTGPVGLANAIVLGSNAAVTLSGAPFLFAGGSITLNGSNTLTVNSTAPTTAGLVPTQSTINDIVKGSAAGNTLTVAGSSTLALDSTTFSGSNPITLAGTALALSNDTSTAPTFTVNVPTTINNVLGGTGQSLNVAGSSTLTLGGANNYTGGTNILGGTLALGAANALPSGTTVTFGSSTTHGTLDLAGFSPTFTGLAVASGAAASSQIIGNSSTSSNATLTINGGPTTFGGIIENTLGSGNEQVALTIAGGSLTLTGANTYTGATIVQAGTLVVNGTQTGSAVTVDSGAALGGTGAIGSANLSSGGNLIINIRGVATAGTDYDQLKFGSGALILGGTSTLTIDLITGLTSLGTATNVILCSNITGTFSNVVVNNSAGLSESLQYTSTGLNFTVAATATHFLVSAGSTSITAGGSTTVTVTALDASNSVVTGYTGTVHLTSTDGQAVLPADATLTNGMGIFTVTLKTVGNQTVSATDAVVASITGVSGTIGVARGALYALAVTGQQAYVGQGAAFNLTVTAQDQYGNTIPGYTGTVHFSSSDSAATLPGDYAFTAADAGVHTFALTLNTDGVQTVTVVDTANSALTATAAGMTVGLNPNVPPSGNFNLSDWKLTLPIGPVGDPITITTPQLTAGYTSPYFYTGADGAMVFWGPVDGVTTPGSYFPRSELRETNADGSEYNWNVLDGTATLNATLAINQVPDNGRFVVGQIHDNGAGGIADQLLIKLEYVYDFTAGTGALYAYTEPTPTGSSALYQIYTLATNLPLNTKFTYQMQLQANLNLSVKINGVTQYSSFIDPIWETQGLYFKAGAYTLDDNVGEPSTDGSRVSFYALNITHTNTVVTPSSFVISAPSSATAGTAFNVTVTAENGSGNIATGYTGTVHFTSTDGAAVLPADYTFTAADAGVHTFSITPETAGNSSVTATDTASSSINGTASGINVSAAAANSFVVSAPAAGTAGTAVNVTVTAKDIYGNTATGYSGTVQFSSSDTGALTSLPASCTLTNGVGTFNAVLTSAGAQTITATDASNGSIHGTSVAIAITPAGLNHFAITGTPTSIVAGTAFPVTVTAEDLYGNTVTSFNGAASLSSTDTNAQTVLPSSAAFTNGVSSVTATLAQAGSQTITASSGSFTGTSAAIAVTPAGLAHFALGGTPASIVAGTSFTFTVTAQDLYGNTDRTYAGTVQFSSSDTGALTSLPVSSTLTNGVGTFNAVLTGAGTQTITVTDTSNGSIHGTSAAISVTPASLNAFAVTGTPTSIAAGTAFPFTVTAQDLYGNSVTSFNGTASLSSTDTNAQTVLPGSVSFTNGISSVTATLTQAGSQTITASSGSFTGTSAAIAVTPALDHFAITATPTGADVAGTTFTFTVTAQDQYDNTVTGFAGIVTFSSTDTNAQSSLPVASALTNGVGSFSATLTEAGNQTITVSAGSNTGTSSPIDVVAAGVNHLALTGTPTAAQTAGTAFLFTVTAQDSYSNTVTGYAGTVAFSSTDKGAQTVLPGGSTLTAGVGSFSATLTAAGAQTISASDGSVAGTSNSILVVPSTLDHLALTGVPGSITAGTPFTVGAFAQDVYGNTVTSYAGPISFTTTDLNPLSSLPSDAVLTNGAGSFSATLDQAGGQTITVSNGTLTITSGTIFVTPAAVDQFALTGTPTTSVAGTASSFTVTAQDLYGNTVPTYAGTVQFSSTDMGSLTSLPASSTLTNGTGTFSAVLTSAGTQTITASDTGNGSINGTSGTISVTPASLNGFAVTGTPTSIAAGTGFPFTVTAVDLYGNTVTSFNGAASLSSTDTNAQTVLPSSVSFASGVSSVTATLTEAGSQTITASSGSFTGTSAAMVVTPALDHFAITATPTGADVAGTTFTFTVTAQDQYDNTVTGFSGIVTFSSTDTNAQSSLPAASALTNGVGSFSATLTDAGSQTITVSAGSNTGTSNPINVVAAGVDHLALTGTPTTAQTAGAAFSFTVTAQDVYGNTATGYGGTVHFSSSDANALTSLPANSALSNGVGSFSATLTKAGTQSITATDTVTSSITGTGSVAISAAAATHFTVTAPASATAGSAITTSVTALDTYGNTATGYSGTVHFSSSDGNALTSLPGNSTLSNGVGSFSATLTKAGTQSITATDTVTSSITGTGSIIVSAAAATHFAVSAPTSATAGSAFTTNVTALDTYGNTATGYGGTVHFGSSDTNALTSVPANSTLSNGVGSFSATLTKAGTQTITATDTVTSSIAGTGSVAVSAAAATHFAVSAPTSATAGSAFTTTVTALDSYGNTATGYSGTVHFSSSDGNALTSLPGNSTLSNGVGSFSATLTKAGTQTITPTDTVTSSIAGTGSVAVSAAAATHFAVSAPTSATAGSAFTTTVTALDSYGNTATGYSGTVHFSSSDGNALTSLPGNSTLSNGVGSFSATLTKAGTQTITPTDTVTSSIAGTGSVAVSAAAATHFAVSAPTSATAGSAITTSVTALDTYGNTATGYSGTVHFSSSDGNALTSLPGNSTLSKGIGSFSPTLTKAGSQTITATDTVSSAVTGSSGSIAVGAAAASRFVVSAPASVIASTAFTFTVTAADTYGNTATGYGGTVHFSSSDAQAVLPASSTLTSGAGSFSATLKSVGSQTLTATDAVNSSITGFSAATVAPAATGVPVATPSSASLAANATLKIKGSGFSTTLANDVVTFNDGVTGSVTAATATQLTVSALTNLSAGQLLTASVQVSGVSSVAPVQVATVIPDVSSSSTSVAVNATSMTISGYGFSTTPGNNVVTFAGGGVTGTVTAATATKLTVTGLTGLLVGSLSASVASNGYSSGTAVQVATVTPVVSSSSTNLAVNATSMTISGFGFSTTPGNNVVTFAGGGTTGTVTAATATQLTVTGLSGLAVGSLKASVSTGGVASGSAVETATVVPVVSPSATTFTANTTSLTINGFGFSTTPANDVVSFNNGTTGTVTAASATQLTVTALQKLTAGPLTASVKVSSVSSGTAVQVAAVIPMLTPNTASLAASATTLIISGFGFSTTPANDVVTFSNGVTGTVNSATATQLTITSLKNLSAGQQLTASVQVLGVNGVAAVQVAAVIPAVTSNTANLAANATTLTINGFGFSTTPGDNVVTFSGGVTGTVTAATATKLTVTSLNGLLTVGTLTASVSINGIASGTAVQVATVIPVITPSTANLAANATTLTINGYGFSTTPANNVVTFSNGVIGTVTAATATKLTVSLSSLVAGPLDASVATNGEKSGAAVQVATVL